MEQGAVAVFEHSLLCYSAAKFVLVPEISDDLRVPGWPTAGW